jgi:CheY-like chemotaxis protein
MYKILMVDDEIDLDTLIQQRFRKEIREGIYQFFFARHGREALAIIKAHPDISVVLSDLNMPEMNGLDLLLTLKKDYPHLRVVILSAYGDQENRTLAFQNGATDFIIKPIIFSELATKLKNLVQQE